MVDSIVAVGINYESRCVDKSDNSLKNLEANMKKKDPISNCPKFNIGDEQNLRKTNLYKIAKEIDKNHSYRWIDNLHARSSVTRALTVFYALMVTIFALVFELSHLLADQTRQNVDRQHLIFGMYMYGGSILFLLYCYIVLLLNPQWRIVVDKMKTIITLKKIRTESTLDETSINTASIRRKVSHDSPSAGSLFLRLGCVAFGIVGVVYYAFRVFLSVADASRKQFPIDFEDICAIIFIFTQMHFIFCNWKISITGYHTIARFGTMHLVAANLWTWIRYVLIEEGVQDKEIGDIYVKISNDSSNLSDEKSFSKQLDRCYAVDCILGSFTELMYTSLVEYSLISAAVMFIVWRNIGNVKFPDEYVKRKYHIRINCSKSITGLFFGLAFLAASFTSIAVYYGYTIIKENQTASFIFSFTDIFQHVTSGLVCVYALWRMRLLSYDHGNKQRDNMNPNQELLDMILLSLGMTGEMLYSVAGLIGLTGEESWQALSFVLLIGHIARITQVGVQSCLIYIAGKLRIQGDPQLRQTQPGKQAITFLLIANIAMFLMDFFESEKAGVSGAVVNFYGEKSWVFLIRTFSPLTIFYRFHSSVCLAEIWKNAYTWKE